VSVEPLQVRTRPGVRRAAWKDVVHAVARASCQDLDRGVRHRAGGCVYESAGGPALNVYQSTTAGQTSATLATWYVEDLDQIVDELTAAGVEISRYDQLEHDAKGITARAGGGRIAWFQDPDGNTFAVEADA
jgi:predicted enzyme related to lactoylglutathione lyase